MGYNISGEAVMAIEWTLFALAYCLVGLRIGVRIARRQQKHVIISDCLLIASALDCLGLIICDTWTYSLGGMRYIPQGEALSAADMKNEVILDKISFASNYFYDTGMYWPKAALIALYFKIIPSTMPRLRRSLYVVTGFVVACAITTCLLDTLWCAPNIASNWSLEEGACSAFNSLLVLQIDWAMNCFSDVAIFVLPFPLLRHLHLNRNQIYGLLLTFALGLATIAVNLARFITIQTGNNWNAVFIWSMAEMAVAIIVVSLPALKTLLRRKSKTSTTSKSYSDGHHYVVTASRGRSLFARDDPLDDEGSDVELNRVVGKRDVIYKTKEISEWILLVAAYVLVGLRMYTRLLVQRQKLRLSEYILLFSALIGLGLIICDTLTFELGVMDDWEPSVKLSKISFASNYFYDFGMGFPKLSMLAFYWGVFPADRPTLRKAMYVVTAYVCCAYMCVLWMDTFYCGVPVSVQWSQEEGACSVFYADTPFYFNFSMNLSSYIFIYGLPLFLLKGMSKEHKAAIYFTFSLGIVPALTTLIRFITLNTDSSEPNLVYILSMVEMATALAAVSVPGLKPLLDRRGSVADDRSLVSGEVVTDNKFDGEV
ncbi:hypothetical protein KCU77_g5814, partial [Aureobasidium melanogenum]